MINRKEIKKNAQAILRQNSSWAAGFLALLLSALVPLAIFFVLSLVVSAITGVGTNLQYQYNSYGTGYYAMITQLFTPGFAIGIAITTILSTMIGMASTLGQYHYFLNLVRAQDPHIGNAFAWYKHFFKALFASIYYAIRTFLWMIPTLILYTIGGICIYSNASAGAYVIGYICVVIGLLLLFILTIPKMFSYSMFCYVLNDNPSMSFGDVIKASKTMMQGHRMEYFVFGLSFILWYILGTICFIANIYILPYVFAADALFYDNVKNIAMTNGLLVSSQSTSVI